MPIHFVSAKSVGNTNLSCTNRPVGRSWHQKKVPSYGFPTSPRRKGSMSTVASGSATSGNRLLSSEDLEIDFQLHERWQFEWTGLVFLRQSVLSAGWFLPRLVRFNRRETCWQHGNCENNITAFAVECFADPTWKKHSLPIFSIEMSFKTWSFSLRFGWIYTFFPRPPFLAPRWDFPPAVLLSPAPGGQRPWDFRRAKAFGLEGLGMRRPTRWFFRSFFGSSKSVFWR